MSIQKIATINAVGFFFFWLVVLLAGADKPPPPGFLWLVPVNALSALVVYWRIPTYIQWSRTKKRGRLLRVTVEGFLAGLVVAAPFALFGRREPSVPMKPIAYLGWFAIVGSMGMFIALILYAINTAVARSVSSGESGV